MRKRKRREERLHAEELPCDEEERMERENGREVSLGTKEDIA